MAKKLKKQEAEEEIKEIELEEGSLEELAQQPDEQVESDFSEFMLSPTQSEEMPTPTITGAPVEAEPVEAAETLEEETAEAPATPTIPEAEERDYMTVSNEPFYTSGTSEEEILHGMEERHMAARTAEQLRGVRPRVMMEEWHEVGEARERTGGGGSLRDYTVVEAEQREDKRALPFEEKTKYRTLKK